MKETVPPWKVILLQLQAREGTGPHATVVLP